MGALDVVVVGSGPAGLAAAAQLKRRRLAVSVLERGDAVAARWRSRYDGLRLNTFRAYSHLPGSRLPRAAGRYASLESFLAYLEDYARAATSWMSASGLRLSAWPGLAGFATRPDGPGG